MANTSPTTSSCDTLAESMENLRFSQLLRTLDQRTALLLQMERTNWILADIARRHELARREETERLLARLGR